MGRQPHTSTSRRAGNCPSAPARRSMLLTRDGNTAGRAGPQTAPGTAPRLRTTGPGPSSPNRVGGKAAGLARTSLQPRAGIIRSNPALPQRLSRVAQPGRMRGPSRPAVRVLKDLALRCGVHHPNPFPVRALLWIGLNPQLSYNWARRWGCGCPRPGRPPGQAKGAGATTPGRAWSRARPGPAPAAQIRSDPAAARWLLVLALRDRWGDHAGHLRRPQGHFPQAGVQVRPHG